MANEQGGIDMKTIRERAEEYAENEDLVQGTDGFEYCLRDYIKGATEQKVIDIDKACEWLERANSALPPCYKMFKVNIENFRKAMEEEL